MTVKLSNNATSRLATSISSSDTTIVVQAGEGAKFPTLSGGDTFPITMVKADGSYEIGRCTARSSDTLTITRGQEGVSAKSFSAGDRIELRLTEGAFEERLGEKFDKTGGDISGPITFERKVTGESSVLAIKTTTGLKRWEITLPDSATDDLAIKRYDNDGLDLGNALMIDRATGAVRIAESDGVLKFYEAVPVENKGQISVAGLGVMEWDGTSYVRKSAWLNKDQIFTASQRTTVVTGNDLSFDLSAGGNDYSATLAATAVLTFTNIADNAGKSGHIKIVNGSNYTIGAAATTKVKASSLSAISTTGTYLLAYWCDGTNVYITASSNLS